MTQCTINTKSHPIVGIDEALSSLAAARFFPSEATEGAEWALQALEDIPDDIRARHAGCIAFARDTASALIADGLSPPPWNNREMLLRCVDLATALNAISAAIRPATAQPMPSQSRRRQHKPRNPLPHGLKTAAQAAAKLNCSIKTLNAHTDAGELRYVIIGRGKKRPRKMFADADLDTFITAQTRKDIPCPSIKTPARRSGSSISGGEVIDFTVPRRPPPGGKPKR